MSGRAPVRVSMTTRSGRLDGPGVLAAIEATGVPRMRDVTRQAWLVPIDRLDDVLAHLEYVQRRPIELVEDVA